MKNTLVFSLISISLVAACSGGSSSSTTQSPLPAATTNADAGAGNINVKGDAGEPTLRPLPYLMGTAIAGFQVDMGCPTIPAADCEDRNSDWYQWITTPRIENNPVLFMSKDPPSYGPGFYELYEHDLDLAAHDLSNNALRLSIEYSRIFPTSTIGVTGNAALAAIASKDNIAWYHKVFAAMKARGLEPLVTLNHYELPLWLHDGNACNEDIDTCTAKGWAAPDVIVPEIAKYAGFVAHEFGGEVDLWATENEPFSAVVLPSYLIPSSTRSSPPGLYLHTATAKAASVAMIEAHARMYDAVHANDIIDANGDGRAADVGLVYSVTAVSPLTSDASDAKAASDARYFMNDMFLQGVAKGIVDANWDGATVTRSDLSGRLDFLGVNYYAHIKAQANVVSTPLDGVSPYLTFDPIAVDADLDDPSGIDLALRDQAKWGVPLYVTETGIDQANDDSLGASWIAKTSQYVEKDRADGIDVRGYFAWSLMDNYEWNHGTSMRFGMYAVDPTDPAKTRVARPAAAVLAAISGAGGHVPASLQAAYPIP
jgi:beta-glucosidase/6-phospho-beta-glucosidase/beta-galactosidase